MAQNVIMQNHKRHTKDKASFIIADSDEEDEEIEMQRQQSEVKKNLLATNFDLSLNKCPSLMRHEGDVAWLMQQSMQAHRSSTTGRRVCPYVLSAFSQIRLIRIVMLCSPMNDVAIYVEFLIIDLVPCLSYAVPGALHMLTQ